MQQARSIARKREIVAAARVLLIKHGRERMTLADVAKKSGAATGSIMHFYKTKDGLAAAVAEEVIGAIVADAAAALEGHDLEVEPAVRSLLTACSRWPQRFPHYLRLARYIEADPPEAGEPGAQGLQLRLETVLAVWARPLIAVRRVTPLSSAELYAVLIAPVLCDTAQAVVPALGERDTEWIDILSSAALKAIVPQKDAGGAPNSKAGSRTESWPPGHRDLFGRGAA